MIHARDDYNRIQDPEGKIGEEEAVFLLRAKDSAMPATLMDYAKNAMLAGADDDLIIATVRHALLARRQQWEIGSKIPDL